MIITVINYYYLQMSIQVKIKSFVKKCDYKGIQWFSNESLLDGGGIKGIDLAFQNPENNMVVGLVNLHCNVIDNNIKELVQNLTVDSVLQLIKKKANKEKLYELVPCDKLMRLFVPLKLTKTTKKEEKKVIDIVIKLFESAYNTVFQDNIKFNAKFCKTRRLDDARVIIITPHIVTWQIIQFFWNNY